MPIRSASPRTSPAAAKFIEVSREGGRGNRPREPAALARDVLLDKAIEGGHGVLSGVSTGLLAGSGDRGVAGRRSEEPPWRRTRGAWWRWEGG